MLEIVLFQTSDLAALKLSTGKDCGSVWLPRSAHFSSFIHNLYYKLKFVLRTGINGF